jgi:glucose-6-phosphate 1-dehydrogenase
MDNPGAPRQWPGNEAIDMLQPHVFIVFGGTGDLMQRKLMPALHDLLVGRKDSEYLIVGTSRSKLSDQEFRKLAKSAMVEHGLSEEEAQRWCASRLFFQTLGEQTVEDYVNLRRRVEALEKEHGLPSNRILYFALPPIAFEDTITKAGEAGLAHSDHGWTRVVVEKPFGRDLESARRLNDLLHRYFSEDQIYRIDHYLGKETVQNLMVFRFGNAIFESLWNREHVERVDILVSETVGVEGRAAYLDRAGVLRDMVQNHLTQLLTIVAMEVPARSEPNAIRFEKVKVLQSIDTLDRRNVVFGQYTGGEIGGKPVPGYREEQGVAPDSNTETYVALRLMVNNWRWQGVPFTLQTGKRLPKRLTRIAVTFRRPPIALFQTFERCRLSRNVLLMTLQPSEGFTLSFDVKEPGGAFTLQTQELQFRYEDAFGPLPDAYRTLLADIIRGDQTLFVHTLEVEEAWRLYTPLLDDRSERYPYAAGTWGPEEAQRLIGDVPPLLYS